MDWNKLAELILSNAPAIIAALGAVWVANRNSTKKINALHTEINGKMTALNEQTGLAAGLAGERKGRIDASEEAYEKALALIEVAKLAARQVLAEAEAAANKLKKR